MNDSSSSSEVDLSNPVTWLPDGHERATLIGRVWDAETAGPRPVLVHGDELIDLYPQATSVSELLASDDVVGILATATLSSNRRWRLSSLDAPGGSRLLSPLDLQAVKACGVTFVDSMLERVLEEHAGGDRFKVSELRDKLVKDIGGELARVRPGSEEAVALKRTLQQEGMWSQYLEVGIGPDPEVFTKGQALSSVGSGDALGLPPFSEWNNPEPELVLVVTPSNTIIGVTLGNDLNLRDVEGRSALLLGMAKDNTASAAVGPFIRLFDSDYTISDAAKESIRLRIVGEDGFSLSVECAVNRLSRSFDELVTAASRTHQYPDGFALFTGTLFAPTADRGTVGSGFTHETGDIVTISSDHLGVLINHMKPIDDVPRWTYGVRSHLSYVLANR